SRRRADGEYGAQRGGLRGRWRSKWSCSRAFQRMIDALQHGPDAINPRAPLAIVTRPALPGLPRECVWHVGGTWVIVIGGEAKPGQRVEHVGRHIRVARGQEDQKIGLRGRKTAGYVVAG